MKTYAPPVSGNAPESSASVSAPQSANSPPAIQTAMSGSGPGSLSAMPAGDRKIPEPIVEPMSTATALQRPSWRWSDARGIGAAEVAMREWYDPAAPRRETAWSPVSGFSPVDPCSAAGELSGFPRELSALTLHMPSLFADGLFWTSVACCAVAQLFIIRSVRGTRHVPEPDGSRCPVPRHAVEMLWAVLPAIGLVVLLFFTWRAVRAPSRPAQVRRARR